MSRRKLYRYYVECRYGANEPYQRRPKKTIAVNASSAVSAMRGAVKELLSLGIENVQSLRIAGDAVALSDLARMKPPMHKSKVYGAVYAGLDLLGYQHNETGIMLSPDEYRALEEMIDQS